MKWVIIALIVLAVLIAAALIAKSAQRKKHEVARERAGELRTEAATSATEKREQEARAREAKAEADRVRAEADKLEARAEATHTEYAQTQAHEEDRLREADRIDPDVDHRAADYTPGAGHQDTHQDTHLGGDRTVEHTTHDTQAVGGTHEPLHDSRHDGQPGTGSTTAGAAGHTDGVTGPEGPGPVDPRTGEPLDARDPRRGGDQL